MTSAFEIPFEKLPESLPVFPLSGVILLPGGQLPLNIFEPRYINMVLDALSTSRLIGMVQPQDKKVFSQTPDLFSTGCAGRITSYQETDDGRLLVTLRGICRFDISGEMPTTRGYRRAVVNWMRYKEDMLENNSVSFDRDLLYIKLDSYFRRHNVDVDWNHVREIPSPDLINYLAQNLPFEPREKQALLEAKTHAERVSTLMALIDLELASGATAKRSRH